MNLNLFNDNKEVFSWRSVFVDYATVIPLICLFLEFTFGKLRIPLIQIGANICLTLIYLLYTYINQMVLANEQQLSHYFSDYH